MNQPLLSICIPTFNRSTFLAELLDSIVRQFDGTIAPENIEICISDNASDDDTTAVVQLYQKKFKNIQYHRHAENVGAARNISSVLKQGVGKYLWLIGDDDLVTAHAITYISSVLKNADYGAVLLNFSQGEYENPEIIMLQNCLHVEEDKIYEQSRSFFEGNDFKNFFGINFMSAIIYNREQFHNVIFDTEAYLDTCYYQSYVFLYCARTGPLLRIAAPMVIWRSWKEDRRYDEVQTSEEQIHNVYIAYIEKSKELGYMFDIAKLAALKRHKIFLLENLNQGRVRQYFVSILDFFHMTRFIKKLYRIPRVMRYNLKKYE